MQFGQGEMTTKEVFSSQHQFHQGAFYYLSSTCASTDWQQEHESEVQCQNEQLVMARWSYPVKKYSVEVHEW